MHALAVVLAMAVGASPFGRETEWRGFRGNNCSGVSASTGIPEAMSLEENVLWRVPIPAGYSSPIVWGDRVVITAAHEKELLTICLDRTNGSELWRQAIEFDGRRPGANSPAAPTPVTDGDRIYVVFHDVGLVAYDRAGTELWRNVLGPFNIPHGMATSPVLHDELVVLLVDQDVDAYLVAFDKRTGEQKWKVDRSGVTHSYTTPIIVTPDAGPAQVIVSGSLQISAYSIVDGSLLWWVDGSAWQTKAVPIIAGDLCIVNAYMVPSSEFGFPKLTQTWEALLIERDADGDGMVAKSEWDHPGLQRAWFIIDLDGDDKLDERDWSYAQSTASATGGLFAIRLGGEGNVTDTHVAWKYDKRRGLPDIPSPLVAEGTLFMIKEGGLLTAMEPSTGAIIKQERIGAPDRYFASPVAADGKIITASQSGIIAVITAEKDWQVVSTHDLGEDIWATPAIAGGQVFVRSQEALYCFQAADGDEARKAIKANMAPRTPAPSADP